MNVTLNLVADFDDIPKELSHMLRYVEAELQFASKRAANVSDKMTRKEPDCKEAMELLHSIRIHMAKIDSRMEDCMSILSGYQHYLDNPPEDEAEQTEGEVKNEEG